MAKKSRSSAHSTRRHKKVSGDAAWKHSPLVGGGLGIVILICLVFVLRTLTGGGGGGPMLPDDYPHSYLCEEDNGKYDAILEVLGSRGRTTPFTENGKEYWEAYVCNNDSCPGRAAKKKGEKSRPYIFAAKRPKPPASAAGEKGAPPPDMYYSGQIFCPKCKAAYDKASPKKKITFDPSRTDRYLSPKAAEITEQIREKYRSAHKGG